MLNKRFINQKIELICGELSNMEKLAKFSFQEIAKDFWKYNTFERLLEKIVVRAIDINEHVIDELVSLETRSPQSYKETFLKLFELGVYPEHFAKDIARSAVLRNILVHDYDSIDLKRIYSSVKECLEDYHKYCDYILKFLDKQGSK